VKKTAEKAAQPAKNKTTVSKRKDAATKKQKAAETAILKAAAAAEKAAKAEEKARLAKLKEDAENAKSKKGRGRPKAQKYVIEESELDDDVYGNENSYDNVYGNENSYYDFYGDENSYLPAKADTKILDKGSRPDNANSPSVRRLESLIVSMQSSLDSKFLRLQSELDAVQETTNALTSAKDSNMVAKQQGTITTTSVPMSSQCSASVATQHGKGVHNLQMSSQCSELGANQRAKGGHNLHMVRIMHVCLLVLLFVFYYSTLFKDDRLVRTKRPFTGPGHHRSSNDFGDTDSDLKFLERQELQANRDRYFEIEQRLNREKYRLQLEASSCRRFTGVNVCSEFENKHDDYYDHSDKRRKMYY
jgi:hypothetical protein